MPPKATVRTYDFGSCWLTAEGAVGLKTLLDHKDRILRALRYIETHLGGPLPTGTVAKVACLSHYHFHRKFSEYTGSTVSGYIRKRRLSRAADALRTSGRSVTDIGFSLGYGTSEAFTKAFKRRFGCAPSEYRQQYADRVLIKSSARSNPIVLKPLMTGGSDRTRGRAAFRELQLMAADVQPDGPDATWVSVFPDIHASRPIEDAPAYCVAFSAMRYAVVFPGAGTSVEKSGSGSHAVLHMNRDAIVYRRAADVLSCRSGKSPGPSSRLPIALRSILLVSA